MKVKGGRGGRKKREEGRALDRALQIKTEKESRETVWFHIPHTVSLPSFPPSLPPSLFPSLPAGNYGFTVGGIYKCSATSTLKSKVNMSGLLSTSIIHVRREGGREGGGGVRKM